MKKILSIVSLVLALGVSTDAFAATTADASAKKPSSSFSSLLSSAKGKLNPVNKTSPAPAKKPTTTAAAPKSSSMLSSLKGKLIPPSKTPTGAASAASSPTAPKSSSGLSGLMNKAKSLGASVAGGQTLPDGTVKPGLGQSLTGALNKAKALGASAAGGQPQADGTVKPGLGHSLSSALNKAKALGASVSGGQTLPDGTVKPGLGHSLSSALNKVQNGITGAAAKAQNLATAGIATAEGLATNATTKAQGIANNATAMVENAATKAQGVAAAGLTAAQGLKTNAQGLLAAGAAGAAGALATAHALNSNVQKALTGAEEVIPASEMIDLNGQYFGGVPAEQIVSSLQAAKQAGNIKKLAFVVNSGMEEHAEEIAGLLSSLDTIEDLSLHQHGIEPILNALTPMPNVQKLDVYGLTPDLATLISDKFPGLQSLTTDPQSRAPLDSGQLLDSFLNLYATELPLSSVDLSVDQSNLTADDMADIASLGESLGVDLMVH